MVQLLVRLMAAAGREPQLTEALRRMKRQVSGHLGCSGVHVAADIDDVGTFWYSEEWHDLEELEGYMRTNAFVRMLSLLETTAQPPLMEFRVISETRGLEYVATVRGVPGIDGEPAHGDESGSESGRSGTTRVPSAKEDTCAPVIASSRPRSSRS